ncbi:acyl-CoA thioesterase [Fusobacterium russii]|uniref:acyl-CoA thioesterase n=1 Tax=Fusobacterium russii TaxID=854 RepID=UPI00039FF0C1|nr:thioesterase family protein [Fusobacterium russii]
MFKFTYKIKEEDINMGNHVGNERALLFFQYARTEFLKQFNLSQLNLGDNTGLIQLNAYVEYRKQLFLDQEIEISIDSIEQNNLKLVFNYKVALEGKPAILGYTTMSCYDYSLQKVRKIPESFLEILKSFN